MLEGMVKLLPTAEVGFLGMVRDEETFEPSTYAERLPDDLSDRQCFAIDPMLATGGSLGAAIQFLFDRGARDVTAICLLGTPEGVEAIEKLVGDRDVTLVLGSSTRSSTRRATSCPVSVTRVTASTARSERAPDIQSTMSRYAPLVSVVGEPARAMIGADVAVRPLTRAVGARRAALSRSASTAR